MEVLMRVIAGIAGSLPLKTLPGNDTRPTTDRIKETLFNIIGSAIPDSYFLDLYSGSGSIGIEALSRGAIHSVFVEKNRKACDIIKYNLDFTHLNSKAEIINDDAVHALLKLNKKFDIVFMDPPYNTDQEFPILKTLSENNILKDNALIIIEAALDTDFSFCSELGYFIEKKKIYKSNMHIFLRKI